MWDGGELFGLDCSLRCRMYFVRGTSRCGEEDEEGGARKGESLPNLRNFDHHKKLLMCSLAVRIFHFCFCLM